MKVDTCFLKKQIEELKKDKMDLREAIILLLGPFESHPPTLEQLKHRMEIVARIRLPSKDKEAIQNGLQTLIDTME